MARGETDDTQDFNAATEAGGTAATRQTAETERTTAAPVLRRASPDGPDAPDSPHAPATDRRGPRRPDPVTDPRLTETEAGGLSLDDDDADGDGDGDGDGGHDGDRDNADGNRPAAAVGGHRRGPGLWLPLVLFVVLLVTGAAIGRFVVPATVPEPGAAPVPTNASPAETTGDNPVATPTGPTLATPPARPADALAGWAGQLSRAVDIPVVALQAYGYAQLTAQSVSPSCHLTWTTLAGIGEVESHHGQAGGAVLGPNGRSVPPILGPALDGKAGRALVADTDAGAFDADTTFDHAMGPMGILPGAWRTFGIDADGDGILDPYDIDDAALAMAGLLCSGGDDMSQRTGWNKAIGHQHTGAAYAQSVFNAADSYGQRTRNIG
jgi:hypothetical protein